MKPGLISFSAGLTAEDDQNQTASSEGTEGGCGGGGGAVQQGQFDG